MLNVGTYSTETGTQLAVKTNFKVPKWIKKID